MVELTFWNNRALVIVENNVVNSNHRATVLLVSYFNVYLDEKSDDECIATIFS